MDAPENSPTKMVPRKLQAYEALYWFNRLIEATLESLDGLEHLGLLRGEDLSEYKIRIEHTRAEGQPRPDGQVARVRSRRIGPLRSHAA
jgi:hypothetical protein